MDDRYYRALASAIYCGAMSANGRTITTDDQRLRASGLYQEWTEMAYGVGDIRNANGQTWECFQAHDPEITPGIVPGDPAWFTFWRPLHGKSPETARPFVPVMGAHDMYRAGEYMKAGMEAVIEKEALPGNVKACRILPAGLGEKIGDIAALSVAFISVGWWA